MQANKDGFYYVLDRVTGQFISGQPFAQVTWAKGLDEATGRPIVNKEASLRLRSGHIDARARAARTTGRRCRSIPATGLVYIPTSTGSTYSYMLDQNFIYKPGQKNIGVIRPNAQTPTVDTAGTATAAGSTEKHAPPPAIGPPLPPPDQRGLLIAWDPVTQKERWHTQGGGSTGGGTVTTAGNLVFQVIPDGRLVAYRADTGEKLLEIKTGLRGGMGPPIT